MVLILSVVLTAALLAVLFLRRPSTFLFELIDGCFSHGHPTHRR